MDAGNDELARRIGALLSQPDSMEKIRAAVSALGATGMAETEVTPPSEPPVSASAPAAPMPDLSAVSALLPLLSDLNKEDENTALLRALRPYLHGEREKKLEESIKMLQMFKFLPLLKEKGLF